MSTITSSNIARTELTSTTSFSTTSTSDVVITGFTLTPVAGTYLVLSAVLINKTAGIVTGSVTNSFYVAGVQVPTTERSHTSAGGNNQPLTINLQAVVALNGAQAIDVRMRVQNSTFAATNRSLILVRLGS